MKTNTSPIASPSQTPLHYGPAFMLVGYVLFGLAPVLVRYVITQGIPAAEVTFVRFVISCGLVVAIVASGLAALRAHNRRILLVRGILGAAAVLCYFHAIGMTSAGKGTLLNYTHSLWANLWAVLFLGMRPPRGFWLVLGVAGVGVWLVINPRFESINLGDGIGLFSGMLAGGAVLSIKHLRRTDDALVIFTSYAIFGAVFAFIPGFFSFGQAGVPFGTWAMPSSAALVALVTIGVITTIAQLSFTHGYGFTSLPLGTLLSLTVPGISALGGAIFLGEALTPHFILGGTLVVVACGILGLQEGRAAAQRRKES